jgi:glycosylphosphatidylinositol transamidase
MVISASWLSRTGDGDGTLNLRGVSIVLALAAFLKRKLLCSKNDVPFQIYFSPPTDYSYWAKDIVFVISDGYLDGMQAWLGAYHGSEQYSKLSCICHLYNCLSFLGLQAEPLSLSSGVIWTALNIDYPGHSFSHLGVFFGQSLQFKWSFLMSK